MGLTRPSSRAPLFLAAAAVVLRAGALLATWEAPGDGPSRASMAHDWSRAPFFPTHGVWPPGFLYISGAFSFLVSNPLISVRILSVVLGALTVPLFYGLVRRIYGAWPALFGASMLAILPLHVGLSATSLTEATFLFLFVAGTLLLIDGSQVPVLRGRLVAGVAILGVAATLRYDAWVLVPAFPLYHLLKTRRLKASLWMLIALSAFPAVWTYSNHAHEGHALVGFTAAVRGTEAGASPMGLFQAVYALGTGALIQMGFVVPILALAGFVLQLARVRRRGYPREELLYTALITGYVLSIVAFAMARGNIWPRYLIFGLVFALPFAALPLELFAARGVQVRLVATVALLTLLTAPSVLFRPRIGPPEIYISTREPRDIKEVARWLRTSPYRDSTFLTTKLNWQCSYLPLYAPEFNSRAISYSLWFSDEAVRDFFQKKKPALLITSAEDLPYQRRLEPFLPIPMSQARLVHRSGPILVYDIRP